MCSRNNESTSIHYSVISILSIKLIHSCSVILFVHHFNYIGWEEKNCSIVDIEHYLWFIFLLCMVIRKYLYLYWNISSIYWIKSNVFLHWPSSWTSSSELYFTKAWSDHYIMVHPMFAQNLPNTTSSGQSNISS